MASDDRLETFVDGVLGDDLAPTRAALQTVRSSRHSGAGAGAGSMPPRVDAVPPRSASPPRPPLSAPVLIEALRDTPAAVLAVNHVHNLADELRRRASPPELRRRASDPLLPGVDNDALHSATQTLVKRLKLDAHVIVVTRAGSSPPSPATPDIASPPAPAPPSGAGDAAAAVESPVAVTDDGMEAVNDQLQQLCAFYLEDGVRLPEKVGVTIAPAFCAIVHGVDFDHEAALGLVDAVFHIVGSIHDAAAILDKRLSELLASPPDHRAAPSLRADGLGPANRRPEHLPVSIVRAATPTSDAPAGLDLIHAFELVLDGQQARLDELLEGEAGAGSVKAALIEVLAAVLDAPELKDMPSSLLMLCARETLAHLSPRKAWRALHARGEALNAVLDFSTLSTSPAKFVFAEFVLCALLDIVTERRELAEFTSRQEFVRSCLPSSFGHELADAARERGVAVTPMSPAEVADVQLRLNAFLPRCLRLQLLYTGRSLLQPWSSVSGAPDAPLLPIPPAEAGLPWPFVSSAYADAEDPSPDALAKFEAALDPRRLCPASDGDGQVLDFLSMPDGSSATVEKAYRSEQSSTLLCGAIQVAEFATTHLALVVVVARSPWRGRLWRYFEDDGEVAAVPAAEDMNLPTLPPLEDDVRRSEDFKALDTDDYADWALHRFRLPASTAVVPLDKPKKGAPTRLQRLWSNTRHFVRNNVAGLKDVAGRVANAMVAVWSEPLGYSPVATSSESRPS